MSEKNTSVVVESNEDNNTGLLTVMVQGDRIMNGSFEQPNDEGTGPGGWNPGEGAGTGIWNPSGSVSITGNGTSVVVDGSPSWATDHRITVTSVTELPRSPN